MVSRFNPHYFGVMDGTGRHVGILNNNQLSNSDFYTSAFLDKFGNAALGMFDLHLRNGNYQKHEFLASGSMNGFELGAKDLLSRKTGASYTINGRYSFLSILEAVSFDSTGGGINYIHRFSSSMRLENCLSYQLFWQKARGGYV